MSPISRAITYVVALFVLAVSLLALLVSAAYLPHRKPMSEPVPCHYMECLKTWHDV